MTQYRTLDGPSEIQIVEIGPGKGTLICDIVRSAVSTFPDFASALSFIATKFAGNGTGGEGQGGKRDTGPVVGVRLVEVTNGMRARRKESLMNLANENFIVERGYSF
jgi:hypothetical protein